MKRKFMKRVAICFIICLLVSAQACDMMRDEENDVVTIGSFNIEWLGDNTPDDRKPRTVDDLALCAEIVRETNADILAVQEVENEEALERLCAFLPDYRFALISSGGKQNVGFLYKRSVQVDWVKEFDLVNVERGRTRSGALMQCVVGGDSLWALALHLKSTSRADSTLELRERSRFLRRAQAERLRVWTDSLLSVSSPSIFARNLCILGDLNDSPRSAGSSIDTLVSSRYLLFLTMHLHSCVYTHLPAIDHIIVSSSLYSRVARGGVRMVNFRVRLSDADAARISDHCPVTARIQKKQS
jgi:endonuclease/exonuclease/phosphatase family metal-dependent hydrolase